MEDSSASSFSSSYEEEYWLLKKQYDEVLESNSQMVLRLEEAKLTLFKNTRELQSQNSALMYENMNLRAQKEYLQQGLDKLGSLAGNLMEEMDAQKSSVERQNGYLDELVCLVKSVAENKDNNLTNPETGASTEEENGPFFNLTALRQLDKQLRASNVGTYYLPAIEEEKCGHTDNDDEESFSATRRTSSEDSHEVQYKSVQGNSKSKERTVSKIGKRRPSIRTKKYVKHEPVPQDENRISDESLQQMKDEPSKLSKIINSTPDEEAEQKQVTSIARYSDNYMMASMEPSESILTVHEDSNNDSALVFEEKRYPCRDDISLKNGASETISQNSKDIDHQNQNIQRDYLPKTNDVPPVFAQEMAAPQQTPDPIIMKTVTTSYRERGTQHKTSEEKYPENCPSESPSTESVQIETKIWDKHVTEKSLCQVELVYLFGEKQTNHRHDVNVNIQKQIKPTALLQSMKTTSTTKNGEVMKLPDGQHQPVTEKPTNESQIPTKALIAQSSARSMGKDVAKKTSLNRQNARADALETKGIRTTEHISAILQAKHTAEPANGPNGTSAELTYSENKKSQPRKNKNIQRNASTKSGQSLKFEECRDQPEREKPATDNQCSRNMSPALSSGCMTQDATMKTSSNCEVTKANAAPRIEKLSNAIEANESSQVREHNVSTEPNKTPSKTPCSVNKENKPSKTQTIRGDANGTENKIQHALLPLARKSNSSSHNNLFTPVRDPLTSSAKDATDFFLNMESTPDRDESEARIRSRRNETFGTSRLFSLSPSTEDFRAPTGRVLRESQKANSTFGEVRVSVASSLGESCCSDFATPKKVKRAHHAFPKSELVNLLAESASFQGGLVSEVMQEKGIVTRARSKPTRNKEVNYNVSSTSETDESNGGFEFKQPSRRPRRGAKK